MFGALLVVLVVGSIVGVFGRMIVPGHDRLAVGDLAQFPPALAHDDEVRWEVGGGLIGAVGGYIAGRIFDAASFGAATQMRWWLCVLGAVVFTGIAIASGVIERRKDTRGAATLRRVSA
jgi:uncharacterized membrane protein YeaQ/YmgE (transglycosylase-associated protein family)